MPSHYQAFLVVEIPVFPGPSDFVPRVRDEVFPEILKVSAVLTSIVLFAILIRSLR
jgi:hypothetical protein